MNDSYSKTRGVFSVLPQPVDKKGDTVVCNILSQSQGLPLQSLCINYRMRAKAKQNKTAIFPALACVPH